MEVVGRDSGASTEVSPISQVRKLANLFCHLWVSKKMRSIRSNQYFFVDMVSVVIIARPVLAPVK